MGAQGELGSLTDGVPRAAQLDPLTACELPEKKMAWAGRWGREPQMPGGSYFGGTASLGPEAPGSLCTEKQPEGAGQGGTT